MREREKRRRVLLSARMRCEAGWSDVAIRNMSRRGLMIIARDTLRPGKCIEIRRAGHLIIARIVWVKGERMGLCAQDPIDVDGLIADAMGDPGGGATPPGRDLVRRGPESPERRVAERAEDSRRFASHFQFLLLIVAAAIGGWLLMGMISAQLSAPLGAVRRALGGVG